MVVVGGVVLLDISANPSTHLVAVAGIGQVALDVPVDPHGGHAVLDGLGDEALHHGGVARVVARGEDDAFGGRDLLVLTGLGVAHVYAYHAARLVGNQLLGEMAVVSFGATRVLCGLDLGGVLLSHAAEVDGGGEGGDDLGLPVVAFRQRMVVGQQVVGNAVGDVGHVGVAYPHVVDHGLNQPVEHVGHLVGVAAHDGALAHVGALNHVLVDDLLLVQVGTAPALLVVAADEGELAACGVVGLGLLDGDDVGTGLGCGAIRNYAGIAQAHDHDVAALLALNGGVFDDGGLAEPVLCGGVGCGGVSQSGR